jgi:hypothetical protein
VANIDADAALNKEIGGRYGVASYPTIKFFPRGGKEVESYEGGRSQQAFITFLNERCGTHRAAGGALNDEVSGFPFSPFASSDICRPGVWRSLTLSLRSSLLRLEMLVMQSIRKPRHCQSPWVPRPTTICV